MSRLGGVMESVTNGLDSVESVSRRLVNNVTVVDGISCSTTHECSNGRREVDTSDVSTYSERELESIVTTQRRRRRKLVLHFDIRNTILVADSFTQDRVEQALNTFLAGVTWGKIGDGGDWVWLSDRPSLQSPCPGAVIYYKHLEKQLVSRSPDDRAILRRATGDFTQESLGEKFRSCFDEHLRLMEWNYGADSTRPPDPVLTMVGRDNKRYHYLLPSFVKLIYHLHRQGREFSVVLRTFGMDCSTALSCLEYILAGNHPEFPETLPIRVHRKPGWIHRQAEDGADGGGGGGGGRIECGFYTDESGSKTAETLSVVDDELQTYRLLSDSSGINGTVDDFNHWQKNNYSHFAGKPFWIDLSDDRVQHIFFDDNIRVTAEDSIVDVRLIDDGRDRRQGQGEGECRGQGQGGSPTRSLGLEESAAFEDICLVQADLLEIIRNADYFIEKVNMCEDNYERLLLSRTEQRMTSLSPS